MKHVVDGNLIKKIKSLLLSIFLIAFVTIGNSQSELVTPRSLSELVYDAKKDKLTGSLPFDKESVLIIKEAKDFLPVAHIYELRLVNTKWLKRNYEHYNKNNKNIEKKKILLPFGIEKSKTKKLTVRCNANGNNSKQINDSILGDYWFGKPIITNSTLCTNNKRILDVKYNARFPLKMLNLNKTTTSEFHVFLPELDPRKNYEIVLFRKYTDELINDFYNLLNNHALSKDFFIKLKAHGGYSQWKNDLISDNLNNISANDINTIYTSGINSSGPGRLNVNDLKAIISSRVFSYKEHLDFYEKKIESHVFRGYDREKNISSFLPTEAFINKYFTGNYSSKFTNNFELESSLITKLKVPVAKERFVFTQLRDILKEFKTNKIPHKHFLKLNKIFDKQEKAFNNKFFYGNISKNNHNYQKRLKQLKTNITYLNSLLNEVEELKLTANDTVIDRLYKELKENYLVKLNHNKDLIEKKNKSIIGYLQNKYPLSILIAAKSGSGSLKTENSKSLITDFGFVNAFAHNYEGNIKYIARPYFGLNWHIGGINKEQKFNEIKDKDFRHYWSLNVGVTVGKIDTEGYTDFYNGISPMLGVNCRLTRQIRVGVGTLFVRENNPNPIIDDDKIQIAPYASLSFDLDLFGYATKLVGKIF